MIGKVERVELRNVWKHEARDFTTWLANNLEVFSDIINFPLTLVETEKSVGSFNVDILAEDDYGNSIIIENQLEKTDHDHLGKVLTYTINLNAKAAIWVTSKPRPEHIEVISWLNEYTPLDFYLIKVEAIKIGESTPAPLFTAVCEPNEESKEIGTKKAELSKRHHMRKRFWELILERSKERTSIFSNVSPSMTSWISTGVGLSGLALNYTITYEQAGVEIYIDKSKDKEINKKRFDYLYEQKDKIEESLGTELLWQRLDNKNASVIRKKFSKGLLDEDDYEEIHYSMIELAIKLDKEIREHIPQLRKL